MVELDACVLGCLAGAGFVKCKLGRPVDTNRTKYCRTQNLEPPIDHAETEGAQRHCIQASLHTPIEARHTRNYRIHSDQRKY